MGLKDPRAHSHCLGGSRKVFRRRRHKLSVKEYILIQHVGKKVQMLRGCRVGGGGGGVSQTESMPVPGQRSRTSRDLPTGQENDVPGCEMKSATLAEIWVCSVPCFRLGVCSLPQGKHPILRVFSSYSTWEMT